MKNKRYKRLAKRLKGTCMALPTEKSCDECKMNRECRNVCGVPIIAGIREVERRCKARYIER